MKKVLVVLITLLCCLAVFAEDKPKTNLIGVAFAPYVKSADSGYAGILDVSYGKRFADVWCISGRLSVIGSEKGGDISFDSRFIAALGRVFYKAEYFDFKLEWCAGIQFNSLYPIFRFGGGITFPEKEDSHWVFGIESFAEHFGEFNGSNWNLVPVELTASYKF